MTDDFFTDNGEPHSGTKGPNLKKTQSSKRIRIRLIIISITFVVIFSGTASVYWFLAPKAIPIEPPISIKEIVDANLPKSEDEILVDTSPVKTIELPATEISTQHPPPEYVSDPKVLEFLNQIEYEFKQTRDALMYFDDRIDSLMALKLTLESMITTQADSMGSLENRIQVIETQVQKSLELLQTNDHKEHVISMSQPPFRLIAIDRWENQWNAVIELDGRITMIRPQNSRSGWKLLQLFPAKGSAVFRSSSGKKATLEID